MLCDRILDNLGSPTAATLTAGRAIDYLDVTWQELHRRALRASTRSGQPVGVLLPLGSRLRHEDVLVADATRVIAVNHLPCDLLVASPATLRHAALVACELGNLHLPVEVCETEIVTILDGPAEAVFRTHEVSFRTETRRFSPLRASVLNNPRLSQDFQMRER